MTALPLIPVQSSCPGNQRTEKCKIMSLKCYMLELIMVIDEEEIMDNNHADCISEFLSGYKLEKSKRVQFLSTYRLCRESYKSQGWLRFFFLSFLGAYTCAPSVPGTADVQICLKMLRHAIEKSDAMLYATSSNEVEEKCKIMSLKCYMSELIMVIDEEEIMDSNHAGCIADFEDTLTETNPIGCPPCESYSLKNITEFLESLNTLLEEMTVRWKLKIT